MERARAFFDQLNLDYNRVHKTKEDLFWATYMATSEDQAGFERAEGAYKAFISDPAHLAATREHIARLESAVESPERGALLHGLRGWLAVFEANIIDNEAGRALMAEFWPEVTQFAADFTGAEPLISHAKAARLLGYAPRYGVTDVLA